MTTKDDLKRIKSNIERLEERPFRKLNGIFCLAKNIRIKKREQKVVCDVCIYFGEDAKMERYNDVEYKFSDLDF